MRRPINRSKVEYVGDYIPHVLRVTAEDSKRRNLAAFQWNPMSDDKTKVILHPSSIARSVVAMRVDKLLNPVGSKDADLDEIVMIKGTVCYFDHSLSEVVFKRDVTIPAVLCVRLYQTPHHGPPIDQHWLKVPIQERIDSGFFGDRFTCTMQEEQSTERKQLTFEF